MTFDFTTTTFSALITFVSAIVAIGYPLFLEHIRLIDERYNSEQLTAHFKRESAFRTYQALLIVSLVLSFIMPFLLNLFNESIWAVLCVVIHTILVLTTIILLLYLFDLMQVYYDPMQLSNRMIEEYRNGEYDLGDEDSLNWMVSLLVYSAQKHRTEQFDVILNFFKEQVHKNAAYAPSKPISSAFDKIMYYEGLDENYSLREKNIITDILLDYRKGYGHEEGYLRVLWKDVQLMLQKGYSHMFYHYWDVNQAYYSFFDHSSTATIYEMANIEKYKIFQYMIGANVVAHHQNELLEYMVRRESLYEYVSIFPNKKIEDIIDDYIIMRGYGEHVSGVVEECENLVKPVEDYEFYLRSAYLCKFVALLIIQTADNEKSLEVKKYIKELSLEELYKYKDHLIELLKEIKKWLEVTPQKLKAIIKLDSEDKYSEGLSTIGAYVDEINKIITSKQIKQIIEDRNKEALTREFIRIELEITANYDDIFKTDSPKEKRGKGNNWLCTYDISKIDLNGKVNKPDIAKEIVTSLYRSILYDYLHYIKALSKQSRVVQTINEDELFKKLDEMDLNSESIILSVGVPLEKFSNHNEDRSITTFQERYSGTRLYTFSPIFGFYGLFIFRKSDIPKIRFVEAEESYLQLHGRMEQIPSTQYSYTNLYTISKLSSPVLKYYKRTQIEQVDDIHFETIKVERK